MHVHADAIADHEPSYPPTAPLTEVVCDRPTDDLADFLDACADLRQRVAADDQAQLDRACTTLAGQLADQGRQVARGPLVEAARWQVAFQRRRAADAELAALRPPDGLLPEAGRHGDAELYRRRERALGLLLDDEAQSYAGYVAAVLADREQACRAQALLVDEQAQATSQLRRLRGLRGLFAQRRARQLNRDLAEVDRQLGQVQATLRRQQALLDAIDTRDVDRSAWLARHRDTLLEGAAAVVALRRRLLGLANPPGCVRPVREVDLDHPMGHDPLAPPTATSPGNGTGGARHGTPATVGTGNERATDTTDRAGPPAAANGGGPAVAPAPSNQNPRTAATTAAPGRGRTAGRAAPTGCG